MTFIDLVFILLIGKLFIADNFTDNPIANSGKNIEIQILFTDKQMKLDPSPCIDVRVLIINHTDTVASFFEDWNSWGYFNLSFQVTTIDTTYKVYKKMRDWPKNFPSFTSLFPGDTLSVKYTLSYSSCESSQFEGKISNSPVQSIKIKAVYQLQKEALEDADLKGEIKYKRIIKSQQLPATEVHG